MIINCRMGLSSTIIAVVPGNKGLLYNLLFRSSAAALIEIARDPQHLGADTGMLSVLHTSGETSSTIRISTASFREAACRWTEPGRLPHRNAPGARLLTGPCLPWQEFLPKAGFRDRPYESVWLSLCRWDIRQWLSRKQTLCGKDDKESDRLSRCRSLPRSPRSRSAPIPWMEVVAVSSMVITTRDPNRSRMWRTTPVPSRPNVTMTVPAMIAALPCVAGMRRRTVSLHNGSRRPKPNGDLSLRRERQD